jgi:hypothetical protein
MDKHAIARRVFLRMAAGAASVIALSRGRRLMAQQKRPMPDVIVLIPGITGSVLQKDGRDVWAPSAQGLLGALQSLGRSLEALRLDNDPVETDTLGDGITASRLVPDVHLVPGLWKIDGYTKVADQISRVFSVQHGKNFFEFPYDWRRDNRVAARRLARQSHGWLKQWREGSGNRDAKLILVAHSMGGLVSRYFLECMDGWRETRALISFGTPYWGSLNAFNFICNGYRKSLGPVRVADLTELLRSFTSLYQLLPVYPCYDPGNGQIVVVGETTGIPNVDPTKAKQALAFHREIDAKSKTNASDEDYRKNGYKLHAVAGILQPTLQFAKLVSGRVRFSTEFPGKDFDGDGTVSRNSAKPRNYEKDPTFVVELHGSLQNSKAALGQLAGVLTGSEFESTWGGPGALSLQLLMEDSYVVGEPVIIRVQHSPPDAKVTVRATVQEAATGKVVVKETALRALPKGTHQMSVKGLPAGTYRARVHTGDDSVTDVFVVVG